MPPKRMSDILASSSIDTRIHSTPTPTAATDSSEDPTLPILGATSEHATKTPSNSTKRKRPTNGTCPPNKAAPPEKKPAQTPARTHHPFLYEPWLLLPDKQKRAIEKRTDVVSVAFSKNQNVRAGITKVLELLGARASGDGSSADFKGEGVLAVSAQGEGTVKLVGIVDMVRRIAAEGRGAEGGEGARWCVYTVLSSVVVPRGRGRGKGDGVGEAREREAREEEDPETMDIDDGGAVSETQRSPRGEQDTKKTPVLTVWFAQMSIPGWKQAFGEQELVVHNTS